MLQYISRVTLDIQKSFWRGFKKKKSNEVVRLDPSVEEPDDVRQARTQAWDDTQSNIIRMLDLRKTYGKKVAVKNLSMGIQTGECFGLLGRIFFEIYY
jgi:ATPase subunit of ABC transporter with duplicated ATPase domains